MGSFPRPRGIYAIVATLALTAAAIGVPSAYRLREFRHLARFTSALAAARQNRDAGDETAALHSYEQALASRVRTVDRRIAEQEYATLLVARASAPDAARREGEAASAIAEAALRGDVDNRRLRLSLAELLVRLGRFADARAHVVMLQESTPPPDGRTAPESRGAGGGTSGSDPSPDEYRLGWVLAQAWAGTGDVERAATSAAAIIGFSLAAGDFSTAAPPAAPADTPGDDRARRPTTDAHLLLESLLRDKLAQPEAADRVLERCVIANPHDAAAWFAYAQRKSSLHDAAASLHAYARVAELVPDDPRAFLAEYAIKADRGGQSPDEAGEVIARAVEKFPDNARILEAALRHAGRRRQVTEWLSFLDIYLDRHAKRAKLLTLVADMPTAPEAVDAARTRLSRLQEILGPTTASVLLFDARLLMCRREWFLARRQLGRVRPLVASIDYVKSRVDHSLAQCHAHLREFDEQLAASRRLVGEAVNSLDAGARELAALLSLGQVDQALARAAYLRIALDGQPARTGTDVMHCREMLLRTHLAAQLRLEADRRDWSVVTPLLAAFVDDPAIPAAKRAIARADVLAARGDPGKAAETLAEALVGNQSNASLHAAIVLRLLVDQGPEASLAHCLSLQPVVRGHVDVMLAEARAAARLPREEAVGHLDAVAQRATAIAAPPESARVLLRLAAEAREAGLTGESKRLLMLAAERHPDDIRAHLGMLELASRTGDVGMATRSAAEISRLEGEETPRAKYASAAAGVAAIRHETADGSGRGDGRPRSSASHGEALQRIRHLLVEAEGEQAGWQPIHTLWAEVDMLGGRAEAAIERLERARRVGPPDALLLRAAATLLREASRPAAADALLAETDAELARAWAAADVQPF